MLKPILLAALLTATASAQTMSAPATAPARPTYTGTPGDYIAHDFHFGTGETLPQLKLHYLTLGSPHRNSKGNIDNAVLLLHGTGGDAHSLFNPAFSNVLSTSRNSSSSSPTTSATASPPNPPTACA
jgi:homoserine O-acetyltransferase